MQLSRVKSAGSVIALLGVLLSGESSLAQTALTPSPVMQFGMDAQHSGRSDQRGPRAVPAIRWRVRARHRVFASPVFSPDGAIVFTGIDGLLHGLDREGVEHWAFASPDKVFATPLMTSSHVVVGYSGGAVAAVDRLGRTVWSLDATGEDVDAPAVAHTDGSLYVAVRGITALRPDGTQRWNTPLGTGVHVFGAPALSRDGSTLFVADMNGTFSIVRASDGNIVKQVRVGSPMLGSPLVLDDGAVVIGARDGHVRALDATGTTRWDIATQGEVLSSAAQARDGTIVIGSDDTNIYGLKPADGATAWKVQTSGRVRAHPRIDADGYIYVGSEDDQLYALEPAGTVAWTFAIGSDIDAAVALTPWGDLLLACDDGGLYALGPRR